MCVDGPKSFWTYKRTRHKIIAIYHHFLPCPFIGPKLFWTGTNTFGQVQIIKISPEKSNLNLSKMICTRPKLHWPVQIFLDLWEDKELFSYLRIIVTFKSWSNTWMSFELLKGFKRVQMGVLVI